ncbi:MAG: peptidylprolyl isomerase [Alphaproteobacteria bacterium]|nr:peptidylprolyl isomerase [Alphaproteobacteria bacterium]
MTVRKFLLAFLAVSAPALVSVHAAAPNPGTAKQASPAPAGSAAPGPDTPEALILNDNASNGVAAVVNDSIISDYDLRQRVSLFLATTGVRANAENLKGITRQILTQLETERIQVLEAQRKNITVGSAEVDRAINNILQDNHLTMEQVKKLLANAKVDMATFRSQIAAQLAWTKTVQSEYADKVTITPEAIDAQLKRVTAGADKPHYRVAEIFQAVDSPEQDPQVQKTMQGLLDQIRAGAPFDAIARQFSQNPTAAAGGDLGVVQDGQLVPELNAALEKMHTGEVNGPIKASGGYYLLFLRQRIEPAGTKVPDPAEQPANADPNVMPLARVLLPIGPKPAKALLENAYKAAVVLREHIAGCDTLQQMVSRMKGAMYFNLGKMQLSSLSPEIRNAISKAPPGQSTVPFQSAAGVELIVRCDKAAPKIEVFKMPTKDDVEEQLYQEQMAVFARRYLRDLRRVANVETAEQRGLRNAKSSSASIR